MAPQIIIEISGGVLQAVHATDRSLKVTLVDWDDLREGGGTMPDLPEGCAFECDEDDVDGERIQRPQSLDLADRFFDRW